MTAERTHIPDIQHGIETDVLLLSDINYQPSDLKAVFQLIHRFLKNKIAVVLSTPERLMAKEFVSSLSPFITSQERQVITHAGQEVAIRVLVLQSE